MRDMTCSIPCSSFRQGMITVMLCDLYTIGRAPGAELQALVPYSHEAVLDSCARDFIAERAAAGFGRGETGVEAGHQRLHSRDGRRDGPIPGESVGQRGRLSDRDGSEES